MTDDSLEYYISVLEDAIAKTQPMSQRARVFTSLQRFAERAVRVQEAARAMDGPGFRMVAPILELRDMARTEQSWVDALLRDEEFSQDHTDRLLLYKMMLAVVESTTIMAVAYIGSDREDSEDATWWSHNAGVVMAKTLAVVPQMLALPEDRHE